VTETAQNYESHVRYHWPFHFVLIPILAINLIWSIIKIVMSMTIDNGAQLLLAVALIHMAFLIRIYALKVQDRLIRLEEQLRFQRILPAELAARASALSSRQIVALRFAPDEEVVALVAQIHDGKLSKPDEIKRSIKNWRPDYHRV
jgi:hypothetical protein